MEQTKLDEIQKKVNDLINMSEIEALVKSNEQEFEIGGVQYRVKKANYKQKQEAYKKRLEKYMELLKDPNYMLENGLKKVYLDKGIDIDAIDTKISNKGKRRNDLMLQLGEALKNNSPDTDLQVFKDEIVTLNLDIQALSIQKTSYLEYSIEQQTMIYTISYLTFLILEKKDGDNWVRCWNTFDEFENASETILNKATYYVTLMSSFNE